MAATEARKLARFSVLEADRGFQMQIEDDDGESLELSATRDQLELIADALDDLLAQEDADEGEDGDDGGDDEED